MSLEDNKALSRQVIAAFNAGDLNVERLGQLFAADFVWHFMSLPAMNREQFLRFVVDIKKSFPDFAFTIEHIVAEGDHVFFRFTATGTHRGPLQGIPATHKQFRIVGFEQARITNGRVAEAWEVLDQLGQLQQLGIVRG